MRHSSENRAPLQFTAPVVVPRVLIEGADGFALRIHHLLCGADNCESAHILERAGLVELTDAELLIVAAERASSAVDRVLNVRALGWNGAITVVNDSTDSRTVSACLDSGADDYVHFPVHPIELRSRVQAVLRRVLRTPPRLSLDPAEMTASLGTWTAYFRRIGFRLFSYLTDRPGVWIRSEELRQNVLFTHCAPGASNIRWHISQCRAALGDRHWWVHGDTQRGYMFSMLSCRARHCRRTR
jgi:DNA-binding response OmpR family regulator